MPCCASRDMASVLGIGCTIHFNNSDNWASANEASHVKIFAELFARALSLAIKQKLTQCLRHLIQYRAPFRAS